MTIEYIALNELRSGPNSHHTEHRAPINHDSLAVRAWRNRQLPPRDYLIAECCAPPRDG